MQEEADYSELSRGIRKLNIKDQARISSGSNPQSTNSGQKFQKGWSNNFNEQDQTSINPPMHQIHPLVLPMNEFSDHEASITPTSEIEIESEPVMEVALGQDEQPKEYSSFLTLAGVQSINQRTLLEEGLLEEVDGQTYSENGNNQQDKREDFKIKNEGLKKKGKELFQQKSQSPFVYLTDEGEETFTKISYIQTLTRTQDSEIILSNKREVSVDSKSQLISKKIFKTPIISKTLLPKKKIYDEFSQKQKTLISQDIKERLYEEAKLQTIGTNSDQDFLQVFINKFDQIFSFLPERLKELGVGADPERLKEVKNFISNQANIKGSEVKKGENRDSL